MWGKGGRGKHDLLSFWSRSINLPVILEFSLHFALVLINYVCVWEGSVCGGAERGGRGKHGLLSFWS